MVQAKILIVFTRYLDCVWPNPASQPQGHRKAERNGQKLIEQCVPATEEQSSAPTDYEWSSHEEQELCRAFSVSRPSAIQHRPPIPRCFDQFLTRALRYPAAWASASEQNICSARVSA